METFSHSVNQMTVLLIIMAAGALARRLKITNDDFEQMLTKVVMDITLPGMILSSVLNNTDLPDASTIGQVLLYSALSFALVIALSELIQHLYRNKSKRERSAHEFAMIFGNTGFMGLGTVSVIFGNDLVFHAAIYNIVFNFLVFTFGTWLIKRGDKTKHSSGDESLSLRLKTIARKLWDNLGNPCMAACILAPILAVFNFTDIDGIIGNTCDILGQMTLPASMIVIGSRLGAMNVKSMLGSPSAYITSAVRLLVAPALVFVVFMLLPIDPLVSSIIVVETAMPVAALGIMMCISYDGDIDTMARSTFISTICSVITIPLIAMLVL